MLVRQDEPVAGRASPVPAGQTAGIAVWLICGNAAARFSFKLLSCLVIAALPLAGIAVIPRKNSGEKRALPQESLCSGILVPKITAGNSGDNSRKQRRTACSICVIFRRNNQ